jgi:hypothetical protein
MRITVAPRASARLASARVRAEPTPRRCRASATTTPISVTREPDGSRVSVAMAWPMITSSSVASRASTCSPPPAPGAAGVGAPPVRRRSMAGVAGTTPAKNRR